MWTCDKCNYTTKYAMSFKRHLLRETPCNIVKDTAYMLSLMKQEYEDTWAQINSLLATPDTDINTIHRKFAKLEKFGRKLDDEFNINDFNEIKTTAIDNYINFSKSHKDALNNQDNEHKEASPNV